MIPTAAPTRRTLPGVVNAGSSDVEPTFNGATQTMLINDNFDSYTTFADAVAGGWFAKDGTTVQDTTTNAGGANLIIAGNGGGKAIRSRYDGIANSGGQEAHSWGIDIANALAGRYGHALYCSYDFRVTGGGGFTIDDGAPNAHSTHVLQLKWTEFWNSIDRCQFSTSGSGTTNGVPYGGSNDGSGTMWNLYPQPTSEQPPSTLAEQAGQVTPPFIYTDQGTWQHLTMKYMTQSGAGARNGIGKLWYQSVLVLACEASKIGVDPPNRFAGTQKWCTSVLLDMFRNDLATNHISLVGLNSNAVLWPFTVDFDNFKVWIDN